MSLVSRSKASRRQRGEVTPLFRVELPRFYQNPNLLTKSLAYVRRLGPVIQACGLFAACLLLGGGSLLSDAVLELLSIPVFVFVFPRIIKEYPFVQNRVGWILCAGIVLLPFVQLIPLPPWMWSNLPGHDLILSNLNLLNGPLPWLPISVSPTFTWLTGLSLLPPFTIFFSTVLLSSSERISVLVVLITFSLANVVLGILQVQGLDSLYFFEFTNRGEAVGLFANRNHLAALLYCALVFLSPWVINFGLEVSSQTSRAAAKLYLPILIVGCALLVILGATEMFTRSRAGVALALIGGVASGASAVSGLRGGSRMKIPKWSLLAILAIALIVGLFGLPRFMERFGTPQDDPRLTFARTTLGAALHYLPFGSGFGTFPQVYGIFEKPTDLLPGSYVNRAHNDLAEVFLEGGVFAIGLGLALFVWFVQRSVQIWRRQPGASGKQEILLARSASIAISLLLLHSLVEYPLRMEAITAVLAVSCALLIRPKIADTAPFLARSAIAANGNRRSKRRISQAGSADAPWRSDPMRLEESIKSGSAAESELPGSENHHSALEEIEWPEAWRSTADPKKRVLGSRE